MKTFLNIVLFLVLPFVTHTHKILPKHLEVLFMTKPDR